MAKYLLILIGSASWSITMVKSGWVYSYGMGFWGANGHDGIWHIALAESLSRGSFGMPIFAGQQIQNYHIGFDLLLAIMHKISFIPITNLYFQIIPPILALLIGFLTFKFVYLWTKSETASFWSTFFVYFGGGFGYVLGKGESAFWSQQAVSTLINPPFALSLVLLLAGLIFLIRLQEKFNVWKLLLCILCFGVLIEIKVYAGLLALGGLLVAGLYSLIFNRKPLIIKIFLGSLALSLCLYFPLNRSSGSLIVWQPFWFLETMMGLSDRVGWQKFYSAMMTYKSGHIFIKEVAAYFVALGIFLAGNLGTRIVFLFRKISKDSIDIFIYSIFLAGIAIPMLLLQKGTPWNTIQFFYYSLFFASVLAGIVVSKIKTKLLIGIIVAVTLPTTIITLKDVYIPGRPPAMLSNDEISALSFLSKEPSGVVLTYPFNQEKANEAIANPPRPLYLYTSTAYVSAFSGQPVFLEDEMNLDITGYPWQVRKDEIAAWYKEPDAVLARNFLQNNNIKYIYWLNGQRAVLGDKQLGLKNIFENSSVIIYQVVE